MRLSNLYRITQCHRLYMESRLDRLLREENRSDSFLSPAYALALNKYYSSLRDYWVKIIS